MCLKGLFIDFTRELKCGSKWSIQIGKSKIGPRRFTIKSTIVTAGMERKLYSRAGDASVESPPPCKIDVQSLL